MILIETDEIVEEKVNKKEINYSTKININTPITDTNNNFPCQKVLTKLLLDNAGAVSSLTCPAYFYPPLLPSPTPSCHTGSRSLQAIRKSVARGGGGKRDR